MQYSPYKTTLSNQPDSYNLITMDYGDLYRMLMFNANETVYGRNFEINAVFERMLLDYFDHRHGPVIKSADPHGLASITVQPRGQLLDVITLYGAIGRITHQWLPGYRAHMHQDQVGVVDASVFGNRHLTLAIRQPAFNLFIKKRSVFE